jgi:hypothetical protein
MICFTLLRQGAIRTLTIEVLVGNPEPLYTPKLALLVMQSVRWQIPLHINPDGSVSEVVVSYKVEAPVV